MFTHPHRVNRVYDPSNPTYNIISDIPEPGTVTLVGLGLAGLLAIRRRKK